MDNKAYIENLVSQAENAEELRGVFSDHFDSITSPVSVSLGLYLEGQKVDDIVKILRTSGIDAVPYYDPQVKDNLSCFVVDGTGLRSPFLMPEDAIKATADIFEIMQQNKIATSRALPVGRENLIPAISEVYEGKIIDAAKNDPDKKTINEFLSKQLKAAAEEMQQTDISADSSENGKTYLYRGGTLGDKPYALTFHRRRRDAAYATKDFSTAATYADGVKGAGLRYREIDGHSYGFIYQYEESKGQRYYSMAGVENPRGSEECSDLPENKADYETLILSERNPLQAIYLKVDDKVVKIADKNGYVSKNWQKFAELHTPYNVSEKNNFMMARFNRQITDFPVAAYERKNHPLNDESLSFNPEFSGLVFDSAIKRNTDNGNKVNYEIRNADFSSVKLPQDTNRVCFTGDFSLDNCSLPPNTDSLNLSKCSGIVGISNCDLSDVKQVVLPEDCKVFFFSNVKLPQGGMLDFSRMKCQSLTFEDQDLSNLDNIKLPPDAKIKFKGKTKLPKNMAADILDTQSELARLKAKIREKGTPPQSPKSSATVEKLRGLSEPAKAQTPQRPALSKNAAKGSLPLITEAYGR